MDPLQTPNWMHNLDVTLTTPLLQLPGIGTYIDDQLKRASLRTVGDLLREAFTKSHHASWSHDWLYKRQRVFTLAKHHGCTLHASCMPLRVTEPV
jgi:hypothetical protein